MTLLDSPPEILLEIFSLGSPDDLVNLCLTSWTCLRTIEHHEHLLCSSIAKSQGLQFNHPTTVGNSPLKALQLQWRRGQSNEALLPRLQFFGEVRKPALEHLWQYYDALEAKHKDPSSNSCQVLMKTTPANELAMMVHAATACAELLESAIISIPVQNTKFGWDDKEKVVRCDHKIKSGLVELAFARGIHFVVRVAIEKSSEAMDELEKHFEPRAGSALHLISQEYRWKRKIARLGVNIAGG
ncbi:hypothetical protein MMC20_002064 [Loxospora ochrophaea]|nr:hypothetical protein [Loxospora ochrophaea]